jgi:protein-S-isoprenylcysteine O-methyltransferase Ste14
MPLKSLSLFATAVSVIAIALLLLRHGLFSLSPVVIALQVVAGLLMLWARLTFGRRSFHAGANPTEGGLVTNGPYRFLRHPIYAAIILFTLAGVSVQLSAINILLALVVTGGMVTRMFCEEPFLRSHYPEYAAYAARTARVVPKLF